jgi:hypothetical protein
VLDFDFLTSENAYMSSPSAGKTCATSEASPPRFEQLAPATPAAATVAADSVATSTATENPPLRDDELQAVTLWVGREFRDELEAVRALLGHAVPSGKSEEVLLHLLRAQRKVLERRRYGSPKPRADSPKPANSCADASYIPAGVRREVYDREGGTCA